MRKVLTGAELEVWSHIHWRGPHNPIPQLDIARLLGITRREVRLITFSLNEKGYGAATRVHPPYGLYAIQTEGERDEYVAQLQSRGHGCFKRARMIKALELDGVVQMELAL